MPDIPKRPVRRYDYAPLQVVSRRQAGGTTHTMVSVCTCHGYTYSVVSWSQKTCELRTRAKFRTNHQPKEV